MPAVVVRITIVISTADALMLDVDSRGTSSGAACTSTSVTTHPTKIAAVVATAASRRLSKNDRRMRRARDAPSASWTASD